MKIELTIDEVNLILRGVAKLPYEQVALLIPKLQSQAQQQIELQNNLQQWQQTTT